MVTSVKNNISTFCVKGLKNYRLKKSYIPTTLQMMDWIGEIIVKGQVRRLALALALQFQNHMLFVRR